MKNKIKTGIDPWSLAQEIASMPYDELERIFQNRSVSGILKTRTYEEAIKEIQEWETAQEIDIGDEVEYLYQDNARGVALKSKVNEHLETFILVYFYNCDTIVETDGFKWIFCKQLKKTGKHFDVAEQFMREVRERKNERETVEA